MAPRDPTPKPLRALIEEARLVTLDSYRRIAPDRLEPLSAVAREAAQSFGASHASVSFVDRQHIWLGGAFGFSRDEAARDGSFCDEVVRSGAPLLVPDAADDPRFSAHELVRESPRLRSYAGVPLVEGGGYTVGTVALFSLAPSRFASSVLPSLVALATVVRDFLADLQLPHADVSAPATPTRRVQGWLGVKAVSDGGPDGEGGLLLVGVAKGSPAAAAGLRPTDILYSIGGRTLVAGSDVAAAMAGQAEGSLLPLRFRRSGQWQDCHVEVRSRRRSIRAG